MSARIVAFLNFKGGVGKTSNVVNLGAALAIEGRGRVLVVDIDPQCNATYWLLRPRDFGGFTNTGRLLSDVQRTTYQIYQDAIDRTDHFPGERAIFKSVPRTDTGIELIPRLDLLPASMDLLETEFGVNEDNVARVRTSLRDALRPLESSYDYILIDCPPNIYHVTQTAVVAAHHILIPYNPDFLSLSGARILCRQLNKMEDAFAPLRPERTGRQVCGFVINRYMMVGNAYSTAIAELSSQIDVLKQHGYVHPECRVLEPAIRQDIKVAESTSEHCPVLVHAPDSIGSEDYRQLASSFVVHLDSLL